MRIRQTALIGLLLVQVWNLALAVETASDPFAPTVTKAESETLQQATALSIDNPAKAATFLRDEIRDDSSAALYFALGNFLFQSEAYAEAQKTYRLAIGKFPRFRSALNNLGRLYLVQEKPDLAIETFQSLLRDGQADAATLRLLGHCLAMKSQPLSSEGAFRQSLILDPGNGDAIRGLIRALIDQQRNDEVLALSRELLEKTPGDEEIWGLVANAYLTLERYEDAIVSIESARHLNRAQPRLLATLGDLYMNRNQPRDAINAYEEAFQSTEPDLSHLLQAIEGLVLLGSTHDAERLLEKVREQVQRDTLPDKHMTRYMRITARLLIHRRDIEGAMKVYTEILRRAPLDAEAMLDAADIHASSKSIDDARLLYERAGRVEGFEAQARMRHAQLEVGQAQYARAIDLLEVAQTYESKAHVARYLEQLRRLDGSR